MKHYTSLLIHGPTFAESQSWPQAIAIVAGLQLRRVSASLFEQEGDLRGLLTNLEEGELLFFEEIQSLRRSLWRMLIGAVNDYRVNVIIGKGPSARELRVEIPSFGSVLN